MAAPTPRMLTLMTAMVPLMPSLLVQATLAFGNFGRFTVLNDPLIGMLNSAKVSPATRLVEPMFVTVKVAPELTTMLEAAKRSLVVNADRSILITAVPVIVAELLTVSVPSEAAESPKAGVPDV